MTKGQQYKYLGTILKLGFRSAKNHYLLFETIYIQNTEEYRWFRAGYLSYKMMLL